MPAGTFINFYLSYAGASAADQAEKILQEFRARLKAGAKGVAITYSANYGQTRKIAETYRQGEWFTGTNGANQAAVMHAMEMLLGREAYRDLRGIVRIAPITTMNGYGQLRIPWSDRIHLEIVKTDLARIKALLDDGWVVLGWQNQETRDDPVHPYAVGGGTVVVPAKVSEVIQATLIQFARDYPG